MGNLCGKNSDEEDSFSGPGRVLGSSSDRAPASRAPVSSGAPKPKPKVTGPGRTTGGAGGDSESHQNPRAAAARAAEQRMEDQRNKPRGKLGREVEAQKKQSTTQTLEQVSKENRATRAMDNNRQTLNYN